MRRLLPLFAFMLAALTGLISTGVPSTGVTTIQAQNPPAPSGLQDQEQRRLARQQQYLREHSDNSGQVRPDLWATGVQQTGQMDVATSLRNHAIVPHSGSGIHAAGIPTASAWQQIGPQPLRIDMDQIFQGAGPDSGEVVDIAIDPTGNSDQIVYIATNDGGIWKTTNGGTSWTPMTETMPSLTMGAVALDPANASIVYAGTGNPFDGGGGVTAGNQFSRGIGIYRSTDGGNTWVIRGGGVFFNQSINRIVLPATNVLLVATTSGLYRSIDGGLNFGSNAPNFNNGAAIVNGFITDLKLDTGNATRVYAAVQGTGILVSTDSGATFPAASNLFTALNGGPTGVYRDVTFAQSTNPNTQTIYALVWTQFNPNPNRATLFKSTDTGANWTTLADGNARSALDNSCQCGYDRTVGVDPQDANRFFIGFQELYASTNGTNLGAAAITANLVHWDHHAIYFSPSSHWGGPAPTQVWIGTDGGVSSSTNGGVAWTNLNETIATNLYIGIDIGRGAANNGWTYGGAQDTGLSEHQPGFPGNDWHLSRDGDGGFMAVDPNNVMHAFSTDNNSLTYTLNGGTSWCFNCGGLGGGAVSRMAVDPNTSANIYASTGAVLNRSTNTATSFTAMHTFTGAITSISTFRADSNVLWIGLANGKTAVTANALMGNASTWTEFTVTGAPAQGVSQVTVDPSNSQAAVAVYAGFSGINPANRTKHVFRTGDNGATWTDISGTDGGPVARNLPDLPVYSVAIDPGTSPSTIIVSNDVGAVVSFDTGASWYVLGTGLPAVNSRSLAIDTTVAPPVLRLGTYGRSTWQLNIPAADTIPPVVTITFPAPNGQNGWFVTSPVTGSVDANDMTTGDSNITAITCTNATVGAITGLGTNHATAPLTVSGDGVHNVSCTATDSAGNTGASAGSTVMPVPIKIDTTPPTISCAVNPVTLTPIDNLLHNVTVTLGQTDATSGPNGFLLSRVYSADGPPPGDVTGFVAGTSYLVGTTTVNGQMRASVSPGTRGRTYQLTFVSFDMAGNQAACLLQVTVRLR